MHISQEFWAENKVIFVGSCYFMNSVYVVFYILCCILSLCPFVLIHNDMTDPFLLGSVTQIKLFQFKSTKLLLW